MSLSFVSKTDLDIPSPSVSADKVRADIIRSCGVVSQIPVPDALKVLSIVDRYVGVDREQEKELSKNLFHLFPYMQEQVKEISERMPLEQREPLEKLANDFIPQFRKKISLLPIAHSPLVVLQYDKEQQQVGLAAMLEAVRDSLEKSKDAIPSYDREELDQDCLALLEKNKMEPFTNALNERYGQKPTVSKKDQLYFFQCIKDIVQTQKKFASALPPISYKEGDSQGFMYAIKKEGKIRGYLFGTMHYLDYMELEMLADISPEVQKRLYECSILGTECVIKLKKEEPSSKDSVDRVLAACASGRGIVNLGIDDEDRDYMFCDLMKRKFLEFQKCKPSGSSVSDITQASAKAYLSGNIELMKAASLMQEALHPSSKIDDEVMQRRNARMADNIDQMLKASYAVGTDLQNAPPKIFFAVGCDHLLSSKDNMVQRLSQKGYTLEAIH
jgi:uncharacterized protein YbaP (TraB family)